MQAIVTRFLPATNYRGSRIKATCDRGSITVSADSALSGDALHWSAVNALRAKFVAEDAKKYGEHRNPWNGPMICGGLPRGSRDACVFVFVDGSDVYGKGK